MLGTMLLARRRPGTTSGLGEHVLVAVSHPATAVPLSQLAAAIARPDRGRVTGVTVVPVDDVDTARAAAQETLTSCEVAVTDEGVAADGRLRVDASVADGLLNGAVEYGASAVVLGWPPAEGVRPAVTIEDLLEGAQVPVLLARLGGYRWERIVLPPTHGHDPGHGSLHVARDVAERLGQRHSIPVVTAGATTRAGAAVELVVVPHARDHALEEVLGTGTHSDVVVAISGRGSRPSGNPAHQQQRGRHPSR